MLRILMWILVIISIVLSMVGIWFALTLLILPICVFWHQGTAKMINYMGRHSHNNFTRGLAEGFVFVSIPVPYLLILSIVFPPVLGLLVVDVVLWLVLGLVNVFQNNGKAPAQWKDL